MQSFLRISLFSSLMAAILALTVTPAPSFAHEGGKDHGMGKGNCHSHWDKEKASQREDALFQKIGVTPKQKQQIEAAKKQAKAEMEPLHARLHEKRHSLMTYLESPKATQEGALAQEHDISRAQEQISEAHIRAMFNMKRILTPEQQHKLADLHRQKRQEWEQKRKTSLKPGEHQEPVADETPPEGPSDAPEN